jgi:NAD(P)-dependent dehydrogenase (short-subunit alcohol dehydrogenase family)
MLPMAAAWSIPRPKARSWRWSSSSLSSSHIRVNGVAPAGIARSQLRGPASLGMDGFKQSDIPEDAFLAKFRSISLLQELPEPEDYALPYIFLASKQNLIVTGQTWVADQGLLNRTVLSS